MPEQWILKGERDNKYVLYIEAYALDYIKKKDVPASLFLYGTRQAGNRERILVYGVSYTEQDNDLFAPYEIMRDLHIHKEDNENRDTIVFVKEEPDGEHRIRGYYVFYEDNPVMKQWLVREQGYASKPVLEACEALPKPLIKRKDKKIAERIVDFGLIVILLMLLSIVIDTLNSPIKISGFVEHLQQIQKMLMR